MSLHKNFDSVEMINQARICYLNRPEGLSDVELANLLNVSKSTAWRYRKALNTTLNSEGKYIYTPTKEEIAFARALILAAGE